MSFFTWSEKFSVGIDSIDRDHMILVDLIDQLHEGFVNRHMDDVLSHVMSSLVEYTHSHFDREEALMEQAGYPDIAAHREVHKELRRQVEEIQDRFLSGDKDGRIGNEMLSFLHDWLYFHIMETDKDYIPCLMAAQEKQKSPQ